MRNHWLLLAAVILAPSSVTAPAADNAATAVQHGPAAELVEADLSFSKTGAAKPLVEAIAAMLDEEAVAPIPGGGFAKGKPEVVAALKANPLNASTTATWAPIRAAVSADGAHGVTYGFMTVREEGKPDRRAKYLAYWVKRPAGWRVIAYKRAPSEPGDVQTAIRPAIVPAKFVPQVADPKALARHEASLRDAEKAFSDRAQEAGLAKAFVEFGSPEAVHLGRGADFTYGNDAIGERMPARAPSAVNWAADDSVLVASSGDLGVTFGYIRRNGPVEAGQPPAVPFFTVWHRASPDAPWRYIAE